jgi:two-component system OmpR family sensor kinase
MRFRRLRLRLTVASFLLSGLVVAGALAASVWVLHVEVDATIRARLHDRAAALTATIDTSRGVVDIAGADDLLLDSPNWVFDASGREVEGSHRHGAVGAAVRRLGASTTRSTSRAGDLHLLAVPLRSRGRIVAVAVSGVDETPYLATLATITRDGVLLGILAVLGATGLAALVLDRSLGPIASMTERAAEWSRHRSGSRFDLGPPRDELTGLAAVLDELLDRVEEALAAERRLTAEVAHELRSPLTLLIGEADLALMSRVTAPSEVPRYERIRDAATSMAEAITALLEDAAAGAEGAPSAVVVEAVTTVAATFDPSITVDVSGTRDRVPVRSVHLERMLAPILDNAVAAARSRVTVQVRADGGSVVILVADDGPGIDPVVVPALFDPGFTTKAGGTGLGLALARRLVREAGGDLRVASTTPATFAVRLPRLPEDRADEVLTSSGPVGALR